MCKFIPAFFNSFLTISLFSNPSLDFVAAPALRPAEVEIDPALIEQYNRELAQVNHCYRNYFTCTHHLPGRNCTSPRRGRRSLNCVQKLLVFPVVNTYTVSIYNCTDFVAQVKASPWLLSFRHPHHALRMATENVPTPITQNVTTAPVNASPSASNAIDSSFIGGLIGDK